MLAQTNTHSRWFSNKRPPPIEAPQPLPHVLEAFQHYIRNEIPTRFIDTSTLNFVDRDAVFDLFLPDIALITEEHIEQRVHPNGEAVLPGTSIYINPRKAALQDIIRDVVQYAIFSHRWTDSEPNYKYISTSVASGKLSLKRRHGFKTAGLIKLANLCKTAQALQYKLVWSDTICIDKTDTTELSEAIHAMFKWYAHAHLCIVHLAASASPTDFDLDPWFKRGWTLQELLAPRRIKFYNKDWQPLTNLLNDKYEHSTVLTRVTAVTGIPSDAVTADNSHGIKGRGVGEIMSWASARKTTRIEDTAYCLYGLFDVNLPITYGEGEKAFPRLVAAIVAQCPKWDVFAWAGQAFSRHPVLPSSPACYPKWDEGMIRGEVGMTGFELTPHGLRLMSVPLIPMTLVAEARTGDESYEVTLSPRPDAVVALGTYSKVTVLCGHGRLQHIRHATDLHACILNYRFLKRGPRGQLQVGRTYVCYLLHMKEDQDAEESTWLKLTTDNVLRITCLGIPTKKTSVERISDTDQVAFGLPLETTFIRTPGIHY